MEWNVAIVPFVLFVGEGRKEVQAQIQDLLLRLGTPVLFVPSIEQARECLATLVGAAEEPHRAKASLNVGDLEVDLGKHEVRWRGRTISLTEHELQIVASLAREPGQAWSFRDLHIQVWGSPYFGEPSAVAAAVKRLRKKLEINGCSLRIDSIRGFGFRLGALSSPRKPYEAPTGELSARVNRGH